LIEPGAADRAVGMERYATLGERCAGNARSEPEDFAVEEEISLGGVAKEPAPGYLPLYRVEKRGIDTIHMAEEISSNLGSRVTFAGMKDSRAVTTQYVTPTSAKSRRPGRIEGEKYSALLVGYVPRPLTRSSVVRNRFVIVLRGCCREVGERIEEAVAAGRERRIPNYFGAQRFGGGGTHRVGEAMVKGDFEGAVRLVIGEQTARGEWRSASPKWGDIEAAVARELGRHPGAWVRALRAVPLRVRRLYVQAYQSYVFNRALSKALAAGEDISSYRKGDNWAELSSDGLVSSYPRSAKETPTGDATPLVQVPGYAFRDYGSRFDTYVSEALRDEGVRPREFYLKEMQEASAEGGFRRPHIAMADAAWEVEGDRAKLSFSLARGQYATVVLREILKPEDPVGSGLG
jgi:tRNA pseudouridine13 synthase